MVVFLRYSCNEFLTAGADELNRLQTSVTRCARRLLEKVPYILLRIRQHLFFTHVMKLTYQITHVIWKNQWIIVDNSRTFTVEKNRLCPIQREARNRVETRRISRRGSVYTRIQMTFTGQAILSYDPAEKNIYG